MGRHRSRLDVDGPLEAMFGAGFGHKRDGQIEHEMAPPACPLGNPGTNGISDTGPSNPSPATEAEAEDQA